MLQQNDVTYELDSAGCGASLWGGAPVDWS